MSDRILVEFWRDNEAMLADWEISTHMPAEAFPDWLRSILSDEETFGIDIKDLMQQ